MTSEYAKSQQKPDPKLLAAKAVISYKSDDGYRSEESIGSMREGEEDPIKVLANTVREASRLLALFGHPQHASEATAEAIKAVADWRAALAKHKEV